MKTRQSHLEAYVEGWRRWDPDLAASAVAPGFVFDDPAWPEPVTTANLADCMAHWRACVTALGGSGEVERRDEFVHDDNGDHVRSHWWCFTGTPFQGAAVMRVNDDGIIYERVAHRSLHGVRSLLCGETGVVINDVDVRWQHWSDEPGQAPVPRYKTILSAGETQTSELFQGVLEYPAGTRSRAHWHTPVETYYVLSGKGIAHLGDKTVPIAAGATVYMPSRVVHWFEAGQSEPLCIFWTLACNGLDDVDFHFVD